MSLSSTPVVTALRVIPVAGRDSMLLNLSGAHGPYFTRNLLILTDSAGRSGIVGCDAGSGSTPYRAMPGRTMSSQVSGKCSTPPEFARWRSGIGAPIRSKCAHAWLKRSSCSAVIGDAGSSAQARWE